MTSLKYLDEEYLGDGCYVSHDGFAIRLRAPRPEGGDHVIYLEPDMLYALVEYLKAWGLT